MSWEGSRGDAVFAAGPLGPAWREHGTLAGAWSEAPWGGGKTPDLQGSSVCGRHQEGFLEEVVSATEAGQMKREGSVFLAEGHSLRLASKPSPLDAPVQVSRL